MTINKVKTYGDAFVALHSLLNNLRIKWKEFNRDSNTDRFINIPDFGIRIRLFNVPTPANLEGSFITGIEQDKYTIFSYKSSFGVKKQEEFGTELMWVLISRGYFAYLRDYDGKNGSFAAEILIRQGWGTKILRKRLEYWKDKPEYSFLYKQTKELLERFSIQSIMNFYPSMFDFLYIY